MGSRQPPAAVRRELRQEANFGCALCGAPVVEYHHIVPWSEEEHFDPERMIALCPNHHYEATVGSLESDVLYEAKQSPANSDIVEYDFYFESESPNFLFGGATISFAEPGNCRLLDFYGDNLISLSYDGSRLRFNANFYSKEGELIAQLDENEWWAKTDAIWDLKYKGYWFKLWNSDEKIGLKIEYNRDQEYISLKGRFYYNGEEILVHPSKIIGPGDQRIGNTTVEVGGEKTWVIFGIWDSKQQMEAETADEDYNTVIGLKS